MVLPDCTTSLAALVSFTFSNIGKEFSALTKGMSSPNVLCNALLMISRLKQDSLALAVAEMFSLTS